MSFAPPSWSLSPIAKLRPSTEDSAFADEDYDEENGSLGASPPPIYDESLVYNVAEAETGYFYSEDGPDHPSFVVSPPKDPVLKQKIMKSTVYCIHKSEGCIWSGPLMKLKGHLNTCRKDALSCPNGCGSKIARINMEDHMLYTCSQRLVPCIYCKKDYTGATIEEHISNCGFEPLYCENKCGVKIQRNRLKAHQVNTCSKRLVSCTYCSRSFTADTLMSHHSKCYMFPVPCPRRCSEEGVPREDVERHLAEECSVSPNRRCDPCTVRDAGCRFRTADPEAMDKHMEESLAHHFQLLLDFSSRQKSVISRLMGQIEAASTSYTGIMTWKIKNYSAKMTESRASEGLELVSMPFFTSKTGYKLQASLFLNGNGGGEGTHMSVYIKLLPGEYDSILQWPFQHTVSFTLLDQNSASNRTVNVVESFIPDPTWPNFTKPDNNQLGFGFPKFVSHTMLNTREYIKDDCIFLRIRVDPARNIAV